MPIKCPVTHPYVFKQGRNCCKTNVEDSDGGEGFTCSSDFFRHPHCDSTCDGGELSINSNCCQNGPFYRCDDGNNICDGDDNNVNGEGVNENQGKDDNVVNNSDDEPAN